MKEYTVPGNTLDLGHHRADSRDVHRRRVGPERRLDSADRSVASSVYLRSSAPFPRPPAVTLPAVSRQPAGAGHAGDAGPHPAAADRAPTSTGSGSYERRHLESWSTREGLHGSGEQLDLGHHRACLPGRTREPCGPGMPAPRRPWKRTCVVYPTYLPSSTGGDGVTLIRRLPSSPQAPGTPVTLDGGRRRRDRAATSTSSGCYTPAAPWSHGGATTSTGYTWTWNTTGLARRDVPPIAVWGRSVGCTRGPGSSRLDGDAFSKAIWAETGSVSYVLQ